MRPLSTSLSGELENRTCVGAPVCMARRRGQLRGVLTNTFSRHVFSKRKRVRCIHVLHVPPSFSSSSLTCACAPSERKPCPCTIPQLWAQMCDSLGRAAIAQAPPPDRLALPQNAYRLLLDFLRCERSFCNYIVPIFRPFGWISLRVVRHDLPPARCGTPTGPEPDGAKGTARRQERARHAVRLALAQEAAMQRGA